MPALKALGMKPAEVLEVIKAATVKGRGGAGFPARDQMVSYGAK